MLNPHQLEGQTNPTHTIEPGDTWLALSLRYRISRAELTQANSHLNQQREPTIGAEIQLPADADLGEPREGRILRPYMSNLQRLSLEQGANYWALASQSGMTNPFRPLLYEPIFIEEVGQIPRELPAGLLDLELSRVPARPGEMLAIRGRANQAVSKSGTLNLGTAEGALIHSETHLVGLIGTGAFFKPGAPELAIQLGEGPLWAQPWRMEDKSWTFNQITLTGEAAEIDSAAIAEERARLVQIWGQITAEPLWHGNFIEPINDYLEYSSLVRRARSYNGGPFRTYHEGLDFSAYGGTEVFAPAGGSVVLAETLYVRGGAVIIDHGLGIYSGYYHLSEVTAEAGQRVEQGELIGKVGTTGLSTGNHLHWDLLVNGVWVDPAAWLEQDLACWILESWGRECG